MMLRRNEVGLVFRFFRGVPVHSVDHGERHTIPHGFSFSRTLPIVEK